MEGRASPGHNFKEANDPAESKTEGEHRRRPPPSAPVTLSNPGERGSDNKHLSLPVTVSGEPLQGIISATLEAPA